MINNSPGLSASPVRRLFFDEKKEEASGALTPTEAKSKKVSSESLSREESPTRDPARKDKPTFISVEGIQNRLEVLFAFNSLLAINLMSQENKPNCTRPENQNHIADILLRNREKVEKNRKNIVQIATGHCQLLLAYETFLKGKVYELYGIGRLEEQLGEITSLLSDSNLMETDVHPKKTEGKNVGDQEASPVKERSLAGSSLASGWDYIRQLAGFKSELESLKNRFEFVKEDDKFAKDYRNYDWIRFMQNFVPFSQKIASFLKDKVNDDKLKQWEKDELAKVKQAIEQSYDSISQDVSKSTNLPRTTEIDLCPLSEQVAQISTEFDLSPLSDQVKKVTQVQLDIARLKAVVTTEKNSKIHIIRPEREMRLFYNQRKEECEELKGRVKDLNAKLILTLKQEQERVVGASMDIQQLLDSVLVNLSKFDGK